jgi:hypothetical protein
LGNDITANIIMPAKVTDEIKNAMERGNLIVGTDVSNKIFIGKAASSKNSDLKTIRPDQSTLLVILPTGNNIFEKGKTNIHAPNLIDKTLNTQWISKTFKFKDNFIDSILKAGYVTSE